MIVFSITTIFAHAQLVITKDYKKGEKRYIEFSYDGIAYGMVLDYFDNGVPVAKLIFQNFNTRNVFRVSINSEDPRPVAIDYKNQVLLEIYEEEGEVKFNEFSVRLSDNDQQDLRVFGEAMSQIQPDWPIDGDTGGGDGGVTTEMLIWRSLGFTAGGSRSIAVARCQKVINDNISTGCTGTTDCYSFAGDFLVVCVCGEICNM